MLATTNRLAECPHCGENFSALKNGKIPTHDFPKPCRQVCPGSGESPRKKKSALWKNDPEQRERDFVTQARLELTVYGFAVVKAVAEMRGKPIGEMKCPLCQQTLRYSMASRNGHVSAKCSSPDCIKAME